MHVDIWGPGTDISNNSSVCHLLNAMFDLTQFVISVITTETHAEHLEKLFMENFLLSFGILAIFVIDTNSRFKSVFKDICVALVIIYWSIARGNHKGVIVERYHQFLNKT